MSTWFAQTWFAGAVMVPAGTVLLLTMGGSYDGIISLAGYVIVPAIVSFLLISVALIIGLPLRIITRWRTWWRDHRWVSPGLATIGALAIVLSRALATTEVGQYEGYSYESYIPQPILLISGAVFLAFGLVHTWLHKEPNPFASLPGEPPRFDGGPRDS